MQTVAKATWLARIQCESGQERDHTMAKIVLLGVLFLLLIDRPAGLAFAGESGPTPLPIGASAPDFCLPGIDGETHCLKDYGASKVLLVVFTCNHCPTAQLYEGRIKQLAADYGLRGVTLVAIQPN